MKNIILVAIISIFTFVWWTNRSFLSGFSNTSPNAKNQTLEQLNAPSLEQTLRGNLAVGQWKLFGDKDKYRNRLAEDFVGSEVLTDKTPEEVVSILGTPSSSDPVDLEVSKVTHLEYRCVDTESYFDLCVDFKNGHASRTYLRMDY